MSAEEPADKPSTKQPSVLELCMAQQSHHQSGIRLSFNPEIADAITLEKWPYHYCAVTGNVNLAAFLYARKVPFNHGIIIANFAADGKDGNTPWKKPITLSPLDIADMAGHRHAALILAMIGTEVPLHWSREKHAAFPKRFRNQAKIIMDVLVSNPFFVGLPGSARVQLVNTLMTSLAQEAVWSSLSPEVWQGRWEDCVGDDYEQAQQLSAGQQKDAPSSLDMPAIASYQFAIRPRQPSNHWRSRLLLGLAVGSIATCSSYMLTSYVLTTATALTTTFLRCVVNAAGFTAVSAVHNSGYTGPFVDALTFCVGYTRPVSTLICVGVSSLLRRNRSR